MSKTAILSVRIVSDAKKAIAGFDNVASKLSGLEGAAKKAAGFGTAAGAAWVGLATQAVSAASDMQQASGAVEAVFQEQADAVMKLADNAAQAVGISASEYANMSALMGAQLKNLGIEHDALVPKTENLIGIGADLSAMYGGTAKEAVEALSSALRGERDPIERYAISIKQSDINARLAAEGLSGLEGDAKKLAETEATLALITEQAAVAQGTFAREAETVAGQQQRATAAWEDAKAALGEQLLPYVTEGAEKLGELADAVGEHPDLFMKAGAAIAAFTASMFGVIGMIKIYRGAVVAFGVVKAVWSAIHNSLLVTAIRVWLLTAAQAVASATRTVTAWVIARAQLAGIWLALQAQALGSAIAAGAAWVAGAARAALAWVVQRAVMAGVWISMQVQAAASALASAAAWAGSAAMAGIGWIAQRAVIGAIWLSMQLQAAGSALAAGAAWVASAARAAIAWVAPRAAMLLAQGATLAAAAAQWVFNAALSANPIGIVIALIAGLAAGLVIAYQKSDSFRAAVDRAGSVAISVFQRIKGWIDSVIGGVSSLIGWISRIRFPSPPAWLSSMFSAAPASMLGVPNTDQILRFMAPPSLNMAASPDLTAARAETLSAGVLGRGAGGGTITVDNSISIEVDGSGIADPRAVADAIRTALGTDARRRGLRPAAGGTGITGGMAWA